MAWLSDVVMSEHADEQMAHESASEAASPKNAGSSTFFLALLAVFVLVMVVRTFLPSKQAAVGSPFPKLEVAGWINAEAPTAESLAGKIVVIDCFATW